MRILFAASEAVPYFKTGGLADVAGALPYALARRGHDVRVVLPCYRRIRAATTSLRSVDTLRLDLGGERRSVTLLEDRAAGGVTITLVHEPHLLDVEDPYGVVDPDPRALALRFALFCRVLARLAGDWHADVVHLNDWQSGLTAAFLRLAGRPAVSVMTVHNLAYQGNFPHEFLPEFGIPWDMYRLADGLEFHGSASFLKAGLVFADRITTVSPTYAREIQTPEYGAGLHGLLRHRSSQLTGILNGLDYDAWDPVRDPALPRVYGPRQLAEKDANREAVMRELGLDRRGPLAVVVSRLAHQKGIDVILAAVPALSRLRVRLAVLGDGEPAMERAFAAAASRYPRRIAAFFRFDDTLARMLYGGGDFFLMPSRFEPCGLGQMIAQRYGTPPIVRRTGGLADTVEDGDTGFTFARPERSDLVEAVSRAVALWRRPGWDALRRRCMRIDYSWDRAAAQYESVYRAALAEPTPP